MRRTLWLEFAEQDADATNDVVGGVAVRSDGDKLDWEGADVWAENDAIFVEVDEAEGKRGSVADGEEGGLVGAVGGEGAVVAIEYGDGAGGENGVHGGGLLGVDADGEEALPVSAEGMGAGAVALEARGRDLDGLHNAAGWSVGEVHGDGGRDDGDKLHGVAGSRGVTGMQGLASVKIEADAEVVACLNFERQKFVDGEVLRGEDAVEALERE